MRGLPKGPDVSLEAIIQALDGRREGREHRCRCPVHDGRSLMAGGTEEKPLVHCKNGCEQEAVIDALKEMGLWTNGATPTNSASPRQISVTTDAYSLVAEYRYIGPESGDLLAIKRRSELPNGDKKFTWQVAGEDGTGDVKVAALPLYNAHLLGTDSGLVFVTEGEKAADACLDADLLAVSGAGGAAQKDFGTALQVLKGRDVVLWPDNDDPGHALMRRLEAKLGGIAASVRTFTWADAPPKGDAYDYFEKGGTKDEIFAALEAVPITPTVEETQDGITVKLPLGGGCIRFRFDSLEHRRNGIDCELTVGREISNLSRQPFSARINLLSLSNRDAYRRSLEATFGKDFDWAGLLGQAIQLARQAYGERDPSIRLLDAPEEAARPSLLAPWVIGGPSIVFGKGGSAKTFLALGMALAVATGTEFLGQQATQANVLYIDYEADAATLKGRLRRLMAGSETATDDVPVFYWPARGVPLVEMVPALRKKIAKDSIGLVIVDSAALAAGAEPERAETAIHYFNALSSLDVPSLILAHETKAGEDQWPFGSIFYHNSARATFNVKLLQEQEQNVTHIGLFNRKANNSRLEAPVGAVIAFSDTSVRITREQLDAEWEGEISVRKRLHLALRYGELSRKQLAEEIGAKGDTIRKALTRYPQEFIRRGTALDGSDQWGLKGG